MYTQGESTHVSSKMWVQVGESELQEESVEGSLPSSPARMWRVRVTADVGRGCSSWD